MLAISHLCQKHKLDRNIILEWPWNGYSSTNSSAEIIVLILFDM